MAYKQGFYYYTKEEIDEIAAKLSNIATPVTITHASATLTESDFQKIGKVATLVFNIEFTANMATNTFTAIGTVDDELKPSLNVHFIGRQSWSDVTCDFRITTAGAIEVIAHGNTNNEGFHGSVSWVTAS